MGVVVGVGRGDAREQVLEAFARQQIAIRQRRLAESGEFVVTATFGHNASATLKLNYIKHLGPPFGCLSHPCGKDGLWVRYISVGRLPKPLYVDHMSVLPAVIPNLFP